ncbi:hypothetical protein CB1_000304013 [Camelus ferus]|nr:hypothetical protein CB1_000304013 [Camelus ferus]
MTEGHVTIDKETGGPQHKCLAKRLTGKETSFRIPIEEAPCLPYLYKNRQRRSFKGRNKERKIFILQLVGLALTYNFTDCDFEKIKETYQNVIYEVLKEYIKGTKSIRFNRFVYCEDRVSDADPVGTTGLPENSALVPSLGLLLQLRHLCFLRLPRGLSPLLTRYLFPPTRIAFIVTPAHPPPPPLPLSLTSYQLFFFFSLIYPPWRFRLFSYVLPLVSSRIASLKSSALPSNATMAARHSPAKSSPNKLMLHSLSIALATPELRQPCDKPIWLYDFYQGDSGKFTDGHSEVHPYQKSTEDRLDQVLDNT